MPEEPGPSVFRLSDPITRLESFELTVVVSLTVL